MPLRPAAPLLGMVVTAAPLPGMVVTAAPLPGTVVTAAPLLGTVNTAVPLLGTADTAVPLPEELAPAVRSSPGVTPPSVESELDLPPTEGSADWRAVIPPARPEDFWYTGEGASGPLPLKAGDPTPLQADVVSSTELSPTGVRSVGPAPLAVPEGSEVSPTRSSQGAEGASEVPAEDPRSPTQARTGHPSIAEVLQQRVVCKRVTVTTIKKEETIEQRPTEAEVEPMVVSGGNTPVAPDDAELDIDEESELLMDETRL